MPDKRQYYFSIDVETDGNVPGVSNMLSLGAVALTEEEGVRDRFYCNLETLPGHYPAEDTMAWWGTQPVEIWNRCRENPWTPKDAMREFVNWVVCTASEPAGEKVLVANPGSWDPGWIFYYLAHFGLNSPFRHRALDVRSFQMAVLGTRFLGSGQKDLPPELDVTLPYTHVAVEDAERQGLQFLNLLRYSRRLVRPPLGPLVLSEPGFVPIPGSQELPSYLL